MATAFDGGYIAVSWSDETLDSDSEQYRTLFLTFPWDSPADAMSGSFAQVPDTSYSWFTPNSKPHPHPDGFLLLTAAQGSPGVPGGVGPEAIQTLWDHNANLLDGPHPFSGLFTDENVVPMDPHGLADGGIVITGAINGEGFYTDDTADTDGTVYVDLDRWGEGGFHERLSHAGFSWPYSPASVAGEEVRPAYSAQSLFLHDGVYTVFGHELVYTNTENTTATVIARLAADGTVVQEPTRLADDVPPVEAGLEETSFAYSFQAFASNGVAILELSKTMYMPLTDLSSYDPSIEAPYPIRLWSRMLDFDGAPLTSWTQLAAFDSHVEHNKVLAVWSGRYFAACYDDPFDTFKSIVMDENGLPLGEPRDLFWEIPPVEDMNLPCDIVAINEDTFVVILGVYANPPEAYENGLYAVLVDANIPVD
jgi:hypothetical protein